MNTKDKIKDAMYRLVASKGYNKASIGQVCKEIGISKPAVYYYYDSKEEIFLDIIQDQLQIEYGDYEIFDTIDDKDSFFEQLYQLGTVILESCREDKEWSMFAAEIDNESKRNPAIREIQRNYEMQLFEKIRNVLKRGVKIGAISDDVNILQCSQIIDAMITGLNFMVFFEDDTSRIAEENWKLFIERFFNVTIGK